MKPLALAAATLSSLALLAVGTVAVTLVCRHCVPPPLIGGGCPPFDSPFNVMDAVCLVRGDCSDGYTNSATLFDGFYVGIDKCGEHDDVSLFGWWQVDDAGSRLFEWKAPMHIGAVFPTNGSLATPVQCTPVSHCSPYDMTTVAVRLRGIKAPKLDGDDVFIPFQGHATIDGSFYASATLDERIEADAPHVTILADTFDGEHSLHAGDGDTFPWGRYLASVVRIVEPRTGVLQPIGWVEIHLSEAKPYAGGTRGPVRRP
jgi:hypothetical protein